MLATLRFVEVTYGAELQLAVLAALPNALRSRLVGIAPTAELPYAELPYLQISQHILAGKPPAIPSFVGPTYQRLIDLFLLCTHLEPARRPSLQKIREVLLS